MKLWKWLKGYILFRLITFKLFFLVLLSHELVFVFGNVFLFLSNLSDLKTKTDQPSRYTYSQFFALTFDLKHSWLKIFKLWASSNQQIPSAVSRHRWACRKVISNHFFRCFAGGNFQTKPRFRVYTNIICNCSFNVLRNQDDVKSKDKEDSEKETKEESKEEDKKESEEESEDKKKGTEEVAEEVKEGSLKQIKDYYELIDTYFATISKKYDDFGAFVVDCYDNISKSLNLAYGGYNYGKK